MEIRFVPDAPGGWLVYDLGTLSLSIPPEYRAAADAVAAVPHAGVGEVLDALGSSGIAVARLTVPGGEWTLTFAARAVDPAPTASIPASPAPVSAPVVPPIPTVSVPPLFDPNAQAGPATPVDPTPEITEIPELEQSLPPAASVGIAEHDGHTVLASDLPRPPSTAQDEDKTVVVDEIVALRARRTESAGLAAPAVAASLPAPVPSSPRLCLELPDGSREPLDAVILVGRAPTPPADAPATRLVRLDGDGDISRNHARVAVEGDTVVVTDLGSRNGTVVRIPGRSAQKLRDGEPTPVLVGTIIDFGGGVELSVREG